MSSWGRGTVWRRGRVFKNTLNPDCVSGRERGREGLRGQELCARCTARTRLCERERRVKFSFVSRARSDLRGYAVAGNFIGDTGATVLSKALANNSVLRSLNLGCE